MSPRDTTDEMYEDKNMTSSRGMLPSVAAAALRLRRRRAARASSLTRSVPARKM